MPQITVFTVDDANKRLPYVQTVVRDIISLAGDLRERQERLSEIRSLQEQCLGESPHSEEIEQMERAVEQDFARFAELEAELSSIEVNVVDRNSGLVEMCSLVNNRPVWINWQPDEKEFKFWRNDDDDCMIRRPLLDDTAGTHDACFDQFGTDG